MQELKKKYGLFTCIAMVAGIVIGSGVFFKADDVLNATGGNMWLSISAWLVGGLVMLCLCYTFCVIAAKHPNSPGLMGYADDLIGSKFSYFIGWFWTTIYAPCMVAVVCWISAMYTTTLLDLPDGGYIGAATWTIAIGYMVLLYAINTLAPKVAGKFQVSALVVKLVPLLLMAIIGTIVGLAKGTTMDNFGTVTAEVDGNPFFKAIIACLFAYDGWIIVTSIVPEIKNAKRNVPLGLLIAAIIVVGVYILYFVGMTSSLNVGVLMEAGDVGTQNAFSQIFSSMGGTLLFVFVVVSCLGTANGMMMSSTRSMYSLAQKRMCVGQGTFGHISPHTNVPTNSSVIGLVMSAMWFVVWYFSMTRWDGEFDISELPIVFLYVMFLPIFVAMMIKYKDVHWFNRFVAPIVSIGCVIFLVIALISKHQMYVLWFTVVFVGMQLIGWLLLYYGKKIHGSYCVEESTDQIRDLNDEIANDGGKWIVD
ncbi:MAG: APC family permease [Firmicutes bacterium]|nr:APC family permease [Bacillota bacterium]